MLSFTDKEHREKKIKIKKLLHRKKEIEKDERIKYGNKKYEFSK